MDHARSTSFVRRAMLTEGHMEEFPQGTMKALPISTWEAMVASLHSIMRYQTAEEWERWRATAVILPASHTSKVCMREI